jgi:hypothetical protein
MSDLQKQITQNLAEAYNLLTKASLNVQGAALSSAGNCMDGFKIIISELNSGLLTIEETAKEGDDETNEG